MQNGLLIAHILGLVAIGAGMGVWIRKLQPGPEPMALSWSIISGIIGACVVSLLAGWVGMFPIGGVLYYTSAPVGAIMALMVYNIIIAKE